MIELSQDSQPHTDTAQPPAPDSRPVGRLGPATATASRSVAAVRYGCVCAQRARKSITHDELRQEETLFPRIRATTGENEIQNLLLGQKKLFLFDSFLKVHN